MRSSRRLLSAEQRNLALAYGLWALGCLGVCGVHRFYNRKPLSGVLWLLTFGFCFVGQLVDLWLMPELVQQANASLLLRGGPPSVERQLVQLARRSGEAGFTLNDALLEMDLPLGVESREVREEIERLLHAQLLDVANDPRGRVIYREP
ncbi:TM2 domain-containing protein [Synechococcus sp. 8F6]|uniref:TM2 domain-containing protein n=1 Tax=Synechococcus sp. 8F6 TaxID=2025606 RepID=UPI000B98EF16|nr:TM2 domain-containing protein [Synechococcus sp. 8F6]